MAGVFEGRRPPGRRAFARLMLLLGALALALFAAALAAPACVLPFAAALGAFVGLLGIGWARVNDRLAARGRDTETALALSLLTCTVVMVTLSTAFPATVRDQFVPVYALLAVSGVLCARSLLAEGDVDTEHVTAGKAASPCGRRTPVMLATLGLYLVGSGMLRGIYAANDSPGSATGNLLHAGLLALLLVAAACYSAHQARRGRTDRLPWVAFVLVCVVALYVAVLFSGALDYVSNELLLPTRPLAMLFVWSGALTLAREAGLPAGKVVGLVALPLFCLGRVAVYATWLLLQGGAAAHIEAVVLGTAFLLTVGVVAYLALPRRAAEERAGTAAAPPGPADAAAGALSELAAHYALSEREAQVLELLVAGNSRARIAEVLVLSVNSVQTYAKSLYRKTGVHSRQELIDLARGRDR